MRPVGRTQLNEIIREGEGVVLVDHVARGADRPSTLHVVSCRWVKRTGRITPLRFARSSREAIRWLARERGEEGEGWQRCVECGGVPATVESDGRPSRAAGQTIWTADRGRGLAWVVSADNDRVELAEFDGPGGETHMRRTVPLDETQPFQAEPGDRCFVELAGQWQAAHFVDQADDSGEMLAVDCDGMFTEVPARKVRFRRLAPLADPLAELGEHRAGKIERFAARAGFLSAYSELAAPYRGLLGVLSAAVDLHPHQIGVARRVLADPVQRYLLGDEVGLGKTIEAGFVIRQRLIDAPRSIIVVLVPPALVWQWEYELETKFALSELRKGGVEISSFDDERSLERRIAPDLVVIDEAHRIAAGSGSRVPELLRRYEAARRLAHQVPRLLLLSATPALHREHDLLAMLHLLDPDTYRLEDLEAFQSRVRERERIGELLLALRPGVPEFLVSSRLPDLRETFEGDGRMQEILDRVEQATGAEESERERAMADARAHVSETYRLHRRLLRNRRATIEGTGYSVRGRTGVELIVDSDPRRRPVDDWLERWRTTLLADARERGGDDALESAANAFHVYVGCATGDLEALRDLVEFRLRWTRAFRESAGLTPEESAAVRRFEISDRQRAALAEVLDLLGDEDDERARRAHSMADQLATVAERRVVVFATAPGTVSALAERLEEAGAHVFTYVSGLIGAERQETVSSFAEVGGSKFLITDATGEEGINLQFADRVVHCDLPLSTTRVEQRIGRVDRHGDGPPVISTVFEPDPPDGFTAWWLRALRDSFHVFDRTTAPVQYAIETVERDLLRGLFVEGLDEAERLSARVGREMEEEQARIDKVDSLDALARQETDDVEVVHDVRSNEREAGAQLARSLMEVLDVHADDLGATVTARPGGGRTVVLRRKAPPLRVFSGVPERPLHITANRRLAVTDESLSLLRPGAPLVEALRLQQEWDDRTQTTCVWCEDGSIEGDRVGVRCELLVRADPFEAFGVWKRLEAARPRAATATRTDADAPLALAALQRRVDAYLPPTSIALWFDLDAALIVEPAAVAQFEQTLNAPGEQPTWADELWDRVARAAGALSVADALTPIRRAAQHAALEEAGIHDRVDAAAEHAERDWQEVERVLSLRAERSLDARSAKRDLQAEREVAGMLLDALRAPVAHWSGAALVVISPDRPTGG